MPHDIWKKHSAPFSYYFVVTPSVISLKSFRFKYQNSDIKVIPHSREKKRLPLHPQRSCCCFSLIIIISYPHSKKSNDIVKITLDFKRKQILQLAHIDVSQEKNLDSKKH